MAADGLVAALGVFLREIGARRNAKLVKATAEFLETMRGECGEADAVNSVVGEGDGDDSRNGEVGKWLIETMVGNGFVEEAREAIETGTGDLGRQIATFGLFEERIWKAGALKLMRDGLLVDKWVLQTLVSDCFWWRDFFRLCQGGLCDDWGNDKEGVLGAIEDAEEANTGKLVDDGVLVKVVEAGMARGWRKMEEDAEALMRYCLSWKSGRSLKGRVSKSMLAGGGLYFLEEGSAADRFFGIRDLVWELKGWLFGEEEKREMGRVLVKAGSKGTEEMMKRLLALGVDVNTAGRNGNTALHRASASGHDSVCRLLLEAGAGVNRATNEGETSLYIAASNGHESICRILLHAGADVNQADCYGWTPLYAAACDNHELVCRLLVDANAEVNRATNEGETPLYVAALNGYVSICRQLLDAGADVNRVENVRWSPLYIAAREGHQSICRVLLHGGAEVDQRSIDGKTPLYGAAEGGHAFLCWWLLEKGGKVDRAANDGTTPLYIAALKGHEQVCRMLLYAGADPLKATIYEDTPLQTAIENSHESIVTLFQEYNP